MRYPKDQKRITHQAILAAAGRVFRKRGYVGSGVDAVMAEAGLTAGGFYSHFRNKEALFAEVLECAIHESSEFYSEMIGDVSGLPRVRMALEIYLSVGHLELDERSCPMPFLLSEVTRAGQPVRDVLQREYRRWRDDLVSHLDGVSEPKRPELAMGLSGLCVGGMALARSLPNREAAEESLAAHRAAGHQMINAYTSK